MTTILANSPDFGGTIKSQHFGGIPAILGMFHYILSELKKEQMLGVLPLRHLWQTL